MANEKPVIKKNTKATISNELNEMIFAQKEITLQAFRMFMFYLGKIDPSKPEKTEIVVPFDEYSKLLGVELNEAAIDKSTDMLLSYTAKVPSKKVREGFTTINHKVHLFSESDLIRRNKDGKLFLTFKCHDDIKEHIFTLKSQFTTFELWNILNLNNFQDIRMYMTLSQYRVAGERTIEIPDLKEMLGISQNSYPQYKEFARTVLKKCQQALKERTDLCFEFKTVGRPAHSVYFEIKANSDYEMLSYLSEPTDPKPAAEDDPNQVSIFAQEDLEDIEDPADVERDRRNNLCYGFHEEIFDEFTYEQLVELMSLAQAHVKLDVTGDAEEDDLLRQAELSAYIRKKIQLCNASRKPVPHRYQFIKKAVTEDWS